MMWSVIVLLVLGMFHLFQNPKNVMVPDKMPFSEFLKNIDDGRVVQVEIKGNNGGRPGIRFMARGPCS